jgi:hypothetical protein
MQTEPHFDPVVAFGLKALSMAMKGKTRQLQRGDGHQLRAAWVQLVPDDEAARDAVDHFLVQAELDQPGAGAGLMDFLTGWRSGAMRTTAEGTEAALRDQVPDQFDWHMRKDCGHE